MDCFICKTKLTLSSLSKHFKLVHDLHENDYYRCTYGNECFTYLSSFSSLSRHLKVHLQTALPNSRETVENVPTITECIDSLLSTSNTSASSALNNTNLPNIDSPSSTFSDTDSSSNFNFSHNGLIFSLQLHNNLNFKRNDILSIQNSVRHNIVSPMLKNIQQILKTNLSLNIEQEMLLSSLFQNIENPFQTCDTEYKLIEHLKQNDLWNDYEEFTINNEIESTHCRGQTQYDAVETTGVLLPMSFQFRKCFEKNEQLLKTLKQMDKISNSSEEFSHFIQGSLWKDKSKAFLSQNKIVIPYFLYIDDAEINNPLGSHCNPVTFVYYSFPVIENCEIYLAALFEGKSYKQFGNEKCLFSLVREIKDLESNGIIIKTSEGEKTVHFILGLILGDNLGINTVLGFTSSFSANYFCRFCKTVKTSTQKECVLNPALLRNENNYNTDLLQNDVAMTGIKESSILNLIDSFHVTQNFSVDAMHDIFEGICHYDLCHIIRKLIEMKYFTLDILNNRKYMFNYGDIEIGNISPAITNNHLLNSHLKMTAREMMSFVNLFPLMVGDLVAQDEEIWLFLLNLLEIIKIITSYDIPRDLAERLKYLIKRHHTNYISLFNDTLKPKHHLLLHYYTVILKSGPLRNFWCFRYEAKHKEFKTYARSITSRKNICVSLAKKYQLKHAYSLMQLQTIIASEVQECHKIISTKMNVINDFCQKNNYHTEYISYSECKYRFKKFKKGCFVCQYFDINVENAVIFEIVEIIKFKGQNSHYILCKLVKIKQYLKHFSAYEIQLDTSYNNHDFKIVPINTFVGPPVNVHRTAQGLHMIQPKQYC